MDALQKTVVDPLQPYLHEIVKVIPKPVHDAVVSLIGAPCHSALLLDLNLTKDPACTSLAISKALGLAIVGASAIVKVPQILKLINSRSSAGVSFVSYALETASLLITLSYGVRNQFPFSTYGESALIAIQDVAVGVLVLTFAGRSAAAATFVAVVAASVYALLFDQTLVDAQTMAYLQAGAGALGIASKAPQIYTIWSEGGTGQLSAFAVGQILWIDSKETSAHFSSLSRFSTTSLGPCPASLLPCKKSTTSSSSTDSLRASLSTWFLQPRCCTTGTARHRRRSPLRAKRRRRLQWPRALECRPSPARRHLLRADGVRILAAPGNHKTTSFL